MSAVPCGLLDPSLTVPSTRFGGGQHTGVEEEEEEAEKGGGRGMFPAHAWEIEVWNCAPVDVCRSLVLGILLPCGSFPLPMLFILPGMSRWGHPSGHIKYPAHRGPAANRLFGLLAKGPCTLKGKQWWCQSTKQQPGVPMHSSLLGQDRERDFHILGEEMLFWDPRFRSLWWTITGELVGIRHTQRRTALCQGRGSWLGRLGEATSSSCRPPWKSCFSVHVVQSMSHPHLTYQKERTGKWEVGPLTGSWARA